LSIQVKVRQNGLVSGHVSERPGYELPLLLLAAFRSIIDDLHAELARCGHDQARPVHGFALQAIGADSVTISDLGRRLGVSKQAAAKTARSLEQAGYVKRAPNAGDGRSQVLTRSALGIEMLELSAEIFDRLRRKWVRQLGKERVQQLQEDLANLSANARDSSLNNLPGWLQ
jgi:DNA-binding MarR family transcriptional regulator